MAFVTSLTTLRLQKAVRM